MPVKLSLETCRIQSLSLSSSVTSTLEHLLGSAVQGHAMTHFTLALAAMVIGTFEFCRFGILQHHGCDKLTIGKLSAKVCGRREGWLRQVCSFAYSQLMQGSSKVQQEGIFCRWQATHVSSDVSKWMGSQCIQITPKVTPVIQ